MKTLLAGLLAPLLLFSSVACLQAAPAKPLVIATYNVENLFDGIPDNPRNKKERAKPKKELRALADTLHQINPDVVVMQEVESLKTLKAFQDKYLKDMGYAEPVLIEGNDPRGIDVALLTRLKVESQVTHKDYKFQVENRKRGFSRDLLQVTLKADTGYRFTVFATHLKSKLGGKESDTVRQAEAQAIQTLLADFQKKDPKANFVLMGDFNDEPHSLPLKPLLSPKNPVGLKDIAAADLGIKPTVFSYHPKKYRSRIDYILVSPAMLPEYRAKSVHILSTPEAYWASDHLPIVAEFTPQDQ